MKYLFTGLCFLISIFCTAQTEFVNADACYDKKDYACALTNYLAGYNNNLYSATNKHIVEFRIGYCYGNVAQPNKAAEKSWYHKSISTKNDYGYSWWNLAILHYSNTNYDSAAISYKKAHEYLTNTDDKQNMLYWTAWSYRKKNSYQLAINEYKKITYRNDKYRIADLSIAESFISLNKYDSAKFYCEKSKEYIKQNDTLYDEMQYKMGIIYSNLAEYGKAMEAFEACVAADPAKIKDIEWEKGIVFSKQENQVKAIEHYKKALVFFKTDSVRARILLNNITGNYRKTTDYKGLINALNEQMQYAADKESYYKEIATVQFLKMNQPKEAAKTIDNAFSLLGKSLDSNKYNIKTWRANMLAMQGLIFLNVKDSAKAIKTFTDAVRYDYSNLTANLRLGDIFWNRGKADEYKKYYNYAIFYSSDTLLNSKEDIARAYGRKSHVRFYNYSSKPADIRVDVEAALKYDSLQKEAIYLWAVALKDYYMLSTYRDRCIALLDKGIKKYSSDKKYLSDLYNAKGVLLDTKKDTAGTRKAFEEGIKIYPDNISLWDNLLKHYTAQNNYAAGLAACDKLIAILKKKNDTKTIAVAFINKGDYLWRQEKKEEAKKMYAEALVWDGDNATAKERAKLQ